MPTSEVIRGDESDRREVRTIFTNTGHGALNALLIVSGGATVAFLTFLGNAVQQVDLVSRIGEAATRNFATALGYFFSSVLYSVLAWGTTYASHAGHHYSASFKKGSKKSRAYYWVGLLFMWGAGLRQLSGGTSTQALGAGLASTSLGLVLIVLKVLVH